MFQICTDYVNTNIPRTIRFSPSIYNKLMDISLKENISFNLLVLQCINYALQSTTGTSSMPQGRADT